MRPAKFARSSWSWLVPQFQPGHSPALPRRTIETADTIKRRSFRKLLPRSEHRSRGWHGGGGGGHRNQGYAGSIIAVPIIVAPPVAYPAQYPYYAQQHYVQQQYPQQPYSQQQYLQQSYPQQPYPAYRYVPPPGATYYGR